MNHLWWGKIPLEVIENYILIRDVGLDASGKLDKITLIKQRNCKYHIMSEPEVKKILLTKKPFKNTSKEQAKETKSSNERYLLNFH